MNPVTAELRKLAQAARRVADALEHSPAARETAGGESLAERLRCMVGTADPDEIRRMLDEAHQSREYPPGCAGPGK